MNKKKTGGSAVPSLSDVDDRGGQDRPLYAARVIGQEVWKADGDRGLDWLYPARKARRSGLGHGMCEGGHLTDQTQFGIT